MHRRRGECKAEAESPTRTLTLTPTLMRTQNAGEDQTQSDSDPDAASARPRCGALRLVRAGDSGSARDVATMKVVEVHPNACQKNDGKKRLRLGE